MSEAFPVTWDDPALAALSWEWNEQACPRILTPLAADWMLATGESLNTLYERSGLPFRMEGRIVNGYAYSAPHFLVPETELPRVLMKMKEIERGAGAGHLPDRGGEPQRGEEPPSSSLAEAWDHVWARMPTTGSAEAARQRSLTRALQDFIEFCARLWPGAPPGDAMKLVQGRPSRLHQVQRDLHRLAQEARSAPAVAQAIVDGGDDLLAVLERVEGGPAFLVTLRQFLGRHGHLGPAFVDLAAPTWGEEPARLLSEIQGRLLHETEDPEIRRARLEAEADAKAEAARRSLRDRPEVLRRFEEALAVAREAAPELEAQHDALEQKGPRRLVLQAGARLAAEGMLARADDVFFLHAREVSAALRQPGDVRPLVARRKADHERWAKVQPPRHLGRHAEAFAAMERHAAGGGRPVEVLKGTGASGGRARGPARIVLSESDFPRVQAGDILVCPTTAPSWVPLFDGVAGLVANTGGLLCHAAILAREFGVPAVVGARDATRRFRDGQIIEVDGGAGTVAAVEDGYKYQTAS